ncbi:L-galactonate transporter [Caulifigura coniformis]|uniref:L-galactonate transporter n=1 Tax=Caulifigura coniformis TaxID=2527983 RepID=A0A517SKH3_9PLAN|nr:MFS transporter [Caulifigura coniformis]QDT56623.1 L-galactonate transporter [Caulifigura coniformis]
MTLEPELQPESSGQSYAWTVVLLLVPVALLNYLDRQMLAAMKSSMMEDIPDIGTAERWGLVLGWFKWVYAALSPLGGYIADRFSRRHVIAASLFVWSAVTWATGHVSTYNELIAARAIMGVSEAFYIPAALALIADFHPGRTRSRAIGFHQMGIYLGIIVGGQSGYVADSPDYGWRWAFSCAGLVGILYALPLFTMLRNPPRELSGEEKGMSPGGVLRELFSNSGFLLMVLYFTLPAMAGWVIKDWGPDILKQKFDLSQGTSGSLATFYVQIPSLIGVLLGGFLADHLMRRTVRGRIYISAVGMTMFLPALLGIGQTASLNFALGFLVLYGLGWGFFDCNNMPILSQVVRPELRATGYGIMNLVSISCGGIADWQFGKLRDQGYSLGLIFGVFAAVALISVVLVLMIRPRTDLDRTQPV